MSSRQSSNGPETSRSPLTSPTERAPRRRPAKSSAPVSEPRRSGTLPAAFEDDELIDYVDDDEDMDARRSSFSSQSARDRRASSIPLSPPSVGSYDGHYQDDDGREMRVDNVLGHWHFAPLLIAIVPPLGAVVGGKADAWSDAILLFIASFYLYQLLKGTFACGMPPTVAHVPFLTHPTCRGSAPRHLPCCESRLFSGFLLA